MKKVVTVADVAAIADAFETVLGEYHIAVPAVLDMNPIEIELAGRLLPGLGVEIEPERRAREACTVRVDANGFEDIVAKCAKVLSERYGAFTHPEFLHLAAMSVAAILQRIGVDADLPVGMQPSFSPQEVHSYWIEFAKRYEIPVGR